MYSGLQLSMRVQKMSILPIRKYVSRPSNFRILATANFVYHTLLYRVYLQKLLNQTIVSRSKVDSLIMKLDPSNLTHQSQFILYMSTLMQPYEPFDHLLRKCRKVMSRSLQEDRLYTRHKSYITTLPSRQIKLSRKLPELRIQLKSRVNIALFLVLRDSTTLGQTDFELLES